MFDIYVLWHNSTPIGIVVFSPPALHNAARRQIFDNTFSPNAVNKWFANVSRIVIDPRYRGAGIASSFLREACRLHARREQTPYIEIATSMGAVNHFAQAAGFQYVRTSRQLNHTKEEGGGQLGKGRRKDGGHTQQIRNVYQYLLDARSTFADDPAVVDAF